MISIKQINEEDIDLCYELDSKYDFPMEQETMG